MVAGVSGNRLDRKDWVAAASDMLAERDIDAVRVERLAKRLGVTKGSFYWHFKDRAALHGAILENWRDRATAFVIARLDRDLDDPRERLASLLALSAHERADTPRRNRGARLELAIRQWARWDDMAADVVAKVDMVRQDYIHALIMALGLGDEAARQRAVIIQAYLLGETLLSEPTRRADVQSVIAALLPESGLPDPG